MMNLSCPIPISDYPTVTLAHGGGGALMHQLITRMFAKAFANPWLDKGHDGAIIDIDAKRIALSTDSYVVHPLFFPGGDIGSLAIHGTVNDLAMCGARPLYLTLGLILEEGLPMDTLWRVVQSLSETAKAAGVAIVTGDTKVVDHGKCDGLYINTAGVGVMPLNVDVGPHRLQPGDAILLSGDVGRHGVAIMAVREGLSFESDILSDCASVTAPVQALLEAGLDIHSLRDLTRGGLATSLVEHARTAQRTLKINEVDIPVREEVQGACELLGLDPLYVANEGRFVIILPQEQAAAALDILRAHSVSEHAVHIGNVLPEARPHVLLKSRIGATRLLDMLSGEQLPRIC